MQAYLLNIIKSTIFIIMLHSSADDKTRAVRISLNEIPIQRADKENMLMFSQVSNSVGVWYVGCMSTCLSFSVNS